MPGISESRKAAPRERGFALLIVLWSLVLLSLMSAQILAAGRGAVGLASNVLNAAQARAAADGAIYTAIYHLSAAGGSQWLADGGVHSLAGDGMAVTVQVSSLGGMINPNRASTALLAGLFQAVGASAEQAKALAQAVVAWRSPAVSTAAAQALQAEYQRAGLAFAPPRHGFADISELSAVIGMQPQLLARVLPELSIYQTGDPDPALADPIVRQALAYSGQAGAKSGAYTGTAPVYLISAEAGMTARLDARRQAVVSITGPAGPAPYEILSLTDGY